jgi:Rrf2 family protein
MRVSKKSEYAVRALVEMVLRAGETQGWRQTSQIAASTGIPEKYLEQILLVLKKAGLLTSRRGAVGGYALQVPPESITLDQVISLLEGEETEDAGESALCAKVYREALRRADDAARRVLQSTTLADLAEEVRRRGGAAGALEYQI